MTTYLYLIDGVSVPKRTYERRKLWGEHPGAKFTMVEIQPKQQQGRAAHVTHNQSTQ